MQNFQQTPVFYDVMRPFAYPALVSNTNQSKTITIATANGSGKAYITIQADHYFLFTSFGAQTNYDNGGGVRASANANAVISQPKTPCTFLVEMQRASANNYANLQLTQAELCSSGATSGKQAPYPVLYGPGQTIAFQFQDLTGLWQLSQAGAAVSLAIQFWMLGYAVPIASDGRAGANFGRLLEYFPGLQCAYPRYAGNNGLRR